MIEKAFIRHTNNKLISCSCGKINFKIDSREKYPKPFQIQITFYE